MTGKDSMSLASSCNTNSYFNFLSSIHIMFSPHFSVIYELFIKLQGQMVLRVA